MASLLKTVYTSLVGYSLLASLFCFAYDGTRGFNWLVVSGCLLMPLLVRAVARMQRS